MASNKLETAEIDIELSDPIGDPKARVLAVGQGRLEVPKLKVHAIIECHLMEHVMLLVLLKPLGEGAWALRPLPSSAGPADEDVNSPDFVEECVLI